VWVLFKQVCGRLKECVVGVTSKQEAKARVWRKEDEGRGEAERVMMMAVTDLAERGLKTI